MNKNQAIFMRVEKKYLLSQQQYELLLQRIQSKITPDKYAKSTICNIYFDTPNFQLIRKSLDKPLYKEKLRLRTYGVPNAESTAFIELKKKYSGIVYKRRIDMKYTQAVNYLYKGQKLENPSQISKEIDWFMNFYYNVMPAMFISYERLAFYCTKDPNLRLTFDKNITWRTEQLMLSDGVWGNQILREGERLMEIKIPGAMPLWLSKELDALHIYPTSFSKYGRGYMEQLTNNINNNQGGIYCA